MNQIENCLLCKHYRKSPCECAHCEDYENFRISDDGKNLIEQIKNAITSADKKPAFFVADESLPSPEDQVKLQELQKTHREAMAKLGQKPKVQHIVQVNYTPNNLENDIHTISKYMDRANEILCKYKVAPNSFCGDKFYTHKDEPSEIPIGYIQIAEHGSSIEEITFPIEWLFTDDDQLEEKIRAYKEEIARKKEEERQKLAEKKAKADEQAELAQLAYLKAKYPDA